jgi:hypothetical protein
MYIALYSAPNLLIDFHVLTRCTKNVIDLKVGFVHSLYNPREAKKIMLMPILDGHPSTVPGDESRLRAVRKGEIPLYDLVRPRDHEGWIRTR